MGMINGQREITPTDGSELVPQVGELSFLNASITQNLGSTLTADWLKLNQLTAEDTQKRLLYGVTAPVDNTKLPPEELNKQFPDVQVKFTQPMTATDAKDISDRQAAEQERGRIIAQGREQSWFNKAIDTGGGFAIGVLDPVGLAMGFGVGKGVSMVMGKQIAKVVSPIAKYGIHASEAMLGNIAGIYGIQKPLSEQEHKDFSTYEALKGAAEVSLGFPLIMGVAGKAFGSLKSIIKYSPKPEETVAKTIAVADEQAQNGKKVDLSDTEKMLAQEHLPDMQKAIRAKERLSATLDSATQIKTENKKVAYKLEAQTEQFSSLVDKAESGSPLSDKESYGLSALHSYEMKINEDRPYTSVDYENIMHEAETIQRINEEHKDLDNTEYANMLLQEQRKGTIKIPEGLNTEEIVQLFRHPEEISTLAKDTAELKNITQEISNNPVDPVEIRQKANSLEQDQHYREGEQKRFKDFKSEDLQLQEAGALRNPVFEADKVNKLDTIKSFEQDGRLTPATAEAVRSEYARVDLVKEAFKALTHCMR